MEELSYKRRRLFLSLDKKKQRSIAVIDDSERSITYGGICEFAREFAKYLPHRTLIFILSENCIGSLIGYISALINRIVPLIINASSNESLINHLYVSDN